MYLKILIALSVFTLGELVANIIVFRFVKTYFKESIMDKNQNGDLKLLLGMKISTLTGILERFVLFFGILSGFQTILVVFGTLKIGTKFDKSNHISNEYFLTGNLISLVLIFSYVFFYNLILNYLGDFVPH